MPSAAQSGSPEMTHRQQPHRPLPLQEADLGALISASQPSSFRLFRESWQSRRFSLIHDARPVDMSQPGYTQALFASALGSLGTGGEACDTSVVFALLLLYHTQRCEPRVPVYLSSGVWGPPARLARAWRVLTPASQTSCCASAERLRAPRRGPTRSCLPHCERCSLRARWWSERLSSPSRRRCPPPLATQPLRRRTTWPRAWTRRASFPPAT